jgi:hypothetical protein
MNEYVVTAIDTNKGYRVTISKEMSFFDAWEFRNQIEDRMAKATPANRWASAIKIEEVEQ